MSVVRSRHIMVLSFTFLELGQAAMTDGTAWMTPIVVRSNMIDSVVGGWSRFLKEYFRLHLLGTAGLCTGGVAIPLGGRPRLLHARVACVLADGEGHMKAWDWRGASCLKPCFKHWNAYKKARLCMTSHKCKDIARSGSAARTNITDLSSRLY